MNMTLPQGFLEDVLITTDATRVVASHFLATLSHNVVFSIHRLHLPTRCSGFTSAYLGQRNICDSCYLNSNESEPLKYSLELSLDGDHLCVGVSAPKHTSS